MAQRFYGYESGGLRELTAADISLLEEAKGYPDATLTFADENGFPFSIKCSVSIDSTAGTIVIKRPSFVKTSLHGKKLNVFFNSVVPIPSGGYTGRKYIVFWGIGRQSGDEIILHPTKSYNWDENKMHFVQYCEVSVKQGRRYMQRLSEEIKVPVKPQLTKFWLFLRATRLPFLTATLIPILLGSALAAKAGFFNPLFFALTLIGAAMVHLGVNTANDFFDFIIGADELNTRPTPYSGGSRVIQYGLLQPSAMIGMSTVCFVTGTGIGVYLSLVRGTVVLPAIIAAGLFLSIFYTAPPFKLVYRGLGELTVFLGFGPIMLLGAYYVQASTLSLAALVASIPVGILTAMILFVNEIPDRASDAESDKRTLVVRLNESSVPKAYAIFLTLVYVSILSGVVLRLLPIFTAVSLLTIPIGFKAYKGMKSKSQNPYFMIPTMAANIKLHLYTGFLLIVGVILAIFVR